ncbi:MAG TPA: ABC transporter ATP-binding protein [Vicinamibacterales bacterium]|nr:ABC transporter ATP-binding protein [Vicinamibacterales bacterium]
MTSLLEVQNAGWCAASASVLDGVTFAVRSGELIALMGRNGSGKSTLLDLIAGLRRPTAGTILLDGRPLDEWPQPAVARVVSHLPQVMRDNIACSAEQLVLMGRYPHAERWWESDTDRELVAQAMSRCDCRQFQHRRVSTLSGGERQRVLLAACLAQEPRLLLLDEPATFLDIDQQLHCFSLLREEASRGTACLAVTHDINLALTFCTRILVLSDRGIAIDVPSADALDEPGWLQLFSTRLDVAVTPIGGRWVWYQ